MKMFTVDLMGTGRFLILGEEGANSGREALEKLLRRSFHACELPMVGHHHGPDPVGILVDDAFVMRVQGTGTAIIHLVAEAGRGMWTVVGSTRALPTDPEYRPLGHLALSHRTLLELYPATGHTPLSSLAYRERLIAGLLLGSVFADSQLEVTPPPAEPVTPARNAANIMQRWARLDFKDAPPLDKMVEAQAAALTQPTAAQVQEVARQLVKLAQVADPSSWLPCPGCGLPKVPFETDLKKGCVGAYLACRSPRTGVPEGEQVSASTSKLEWAKDLTRVPLVVRADDQSEPP